METTNTTEPVIHVRNMTKIYQIGDIEVPALRGVDLDVYPGEMVAIMGPSGSGKSTLMNMIGCMDTPSKGSVKLEGRKLEDLNAHYRYLLLRVFNADNPPLKLDKATAWRRPAWLVFDARDGNQYRLIYGNESTGAASFDLASSVRTLEDSKWPEARLGVVSALTARVELPPWRERNASVIWVALIVAVAATLFLVLKNLKSSTPPGGTDNKEG